MSLLSQLHTKAGHARGRLEEVEDSIELAENRVDALNVNLEIAEKAQVLIQQTAQETQENLRYHIQDLVQAALDAAFPGVYDFLVEFEIKRGRTEARFVLDKDGELLSPMDSTGGGIVDIISFSLRLAAWSLSRTDNLIVLDEPFKFVSVNLRPLCGEILAGLSKRLGLQILMVTHDEELMEVADKVFTVDQKRRKSFVL